MKIERVIIVEDLQKRLDAAEQVVKTAEHFAKVVHAKKEALVKEIEENGYAVKDGKVEKTEQK